MNNLEQMMQQITLLVQAAMQGDLKATQLINQIMQAAKQGDLQAALIAQMVQAVALKMQGKTPSAKRGAKLTYINELKNNCPEGYELSYFKAGGKVCSKCMAKMAKEGTKMASKKCGGLTKAVSGIKVEMSKCGTKMKK